MNETELFIGLAVLIVAATFVVCQEIWHARRVLSAQILGSRKPEG